MMKKIKKDIHALFERLTKEAQQWDAEREELYNHISDESSDHKLDQNADTTGNNSDN